MSHGDTIINGYCIEFCCIASHGLDFLFDNLTNLVQMGMTRDELGEGVDNGNDRFAELLTFHTCCHPKGARSCHTSAFCADATSQLMFHNRILIFLKNCKNKAFSANHQHFR